MNEDPSGESAPTKQQKALGVALTVALGVALLVMIGIGLAAGDGDTEPPTANYTAAITACRAEVEPLLKDPDSAEFSDETYSENEDGVQWRIRGTVRATNSFGAVTPTPYECIASWGGTSFSAEVTQLG